MSITISSNKEDNLISYQSQKPSLTRELGMVNPPPTSVAVVVGRERLLRLEIKVEVIDDLPQIKWPFLHAEVPHSSLPSLQSQ